MGLDRFTAGRIHQIWGGKSYLAAHPNWRDPDPDKICPGWEREEESFENAILHCDARARQRAHHLPDVLSVRESSIWTSKVAIIGLDSYIRAIHTCFPPSMFPRSSHHTPTLSQLQDKFAFLAVKLRYLCTCYRLFVWLACISELGCEVTACGAWANGFRTGEFCTVISFVLFVWN